MSNLQEHIIKAFELVKITDDFQDNAVYNISLPLTLLSGESYYFQLTQNLDNTFTISDNGWAQHELDCILFDHDNFPREIDLLCKAYEVERTGTHFTVTFPNIHTRYAVKKFMDLVQVVCIIGNFGRGYNS